MNIVEKLRQKISGSERELARMDSQIQYKNGFCDGLGEALKELESHDLQYDEVDSEIAREALAEIKADPDKVLSGAELDAYLNRINEVESEAIAFIKRLMVIWYNDTHIPPGIIFNAEDPSISFYEKAKRIISRAKGAHDDGKPTPTDEPGSHNRVDPGT